MKVIMFSGQGSQYKGMGRKLFGKYRTETDIASEILGYDLEELCVKDPAKELGKTQYTQPALYVVNALHYLDQKNGSNPDYFIGHSLGEYNALFAAEAFDFETGLKLVQKRGELMAAASGGGMAAIIGLSVDDLTKMLSDAGYDKIDIANYNTPSQIVVAGQSEDIKNVVQYLKDQKVRAIPLAVSAPFHSRYMKPAADQFADFLEHFEFSELKTPVVSNVTARPYEKGKIRDHLSRQIDNSVKWIDTVRYLMGQNCDEYSELGSSILTKMVNEIKKTADPLQEINTNTNGKAPSTDRLLLGNKDFIKDYGLKYAYVSGGMYRGSSSKELVSAMGKAGMLSFLGTGGLSLEKIEQDILSIQDQLGKNGIYGLNLLNNLYDPEMEMKTVSLYLKHGVRFVEAAAYIQMSLPLVYFRLSGLERKADGSVICNHKILGKISRPEVAEAFMKPAPDKLVAQLLEKGFITDSQAKMSQQVPMSHDICVEADSGGHTDRGVAMVLFPAIRELRDQISKNYNYSGQIRTGLAGGIGTPQSAACAFMMGADFVLTGSINQCTVEAGTSEAVKDLLQSINVQDTDYAPAGDMFEIGARVQVLKRGVLFPGRANKLYTLYNQYDSIDDIPRKTIEQIEKSYFKKSVQEVWDETKAYFEAKGMTGEIEKASANPKHKMALIFRWYFGYSTRIAFAGDMTNKVNFQVHTGPALGAFNQWVKGTKLENWRNRHVDQIGIRLMDETALIMKDKMKQMLA
ncbi:MAG: ACP S-malonyltransferase [Cyclobacteriaceae bacterium]